MKIFFIRTLIVIVLAMLILSVAWVFVASTNEIKAALVGLFGTVGIAAFAHSSAQKRDIKSRHFTEKADVYTKAINMFFDPIKMTIEGKSEDEMKAYQEKMLEPMLNIKSKLMIWANDRVVNAWIAFQESANSENSEDHIKSLIKIIQAMREDLGHDDIELDEGGVFQLVLHNPEELNSLIRGNSNQS